MYKLNKYMITVFYSVFFVVFLWILINGVTTSSVMLLNVVYVIVGSFLIVAALIFMYYIHQKLKPAFLTNNLINCITFLLIAVALCYSGIVFAVTPKVWDLGTVYDSAYQLAVEQGLSQDYLHRYFKRFPNNIGILVFLTAIYKFVAIFGATEKIVYIYVGIAVNIIMIFLSIIVTYRLCSALFNKARATQFLILILFCLPIYLYASTFYTDTIALLFPPLIIYQYVKYDGGKSLTHFKKIAYLFTIALFSFLGMKMKVTIIIVLVAIAILLILQQRYLDFIKRFSVIVCVMVLLSASFNFIINKSNIFNFDIKDAGTVPYTHWVMMGMIGTGGWSEKEYNFTYSFKTVEDAKQGNIEVIKDRLAGFGIGGYLRFLTNKAAFAWIDGTYNVTQYTDLYPIKRTYAHEFVTASGSQKKYLLYFSQCFHVMILVFVLVGLFKRIRSNEVDYLTIVYLSLFGLLLFLLIWESKSRYVFHYIPLLYLCAVDGVSFHRLTNKLIAFKNKITKNKGELT